MSLVGVIHENVQWSADRELAPFGATRKGASRSPRPSLWKPLFLLELVPEELVVNLVMELHFLGLHNGSQQARATVGGTLL